MPSSVITQVSEVKNLRKHPDADRLEICEVGGWQLVCGAGLYKEGERVVYITPDTLITERLADLLEIKQHLSSVKNPDGTFVTNDKGETMLRVRQAKLRGEPSFGTTIPVSLMKDEYGIDIEALPIGANIASAVGNPLGVAKYEPQMRASAGDAEVDHPLFPKYTSVENLRNFPTVIEEDELVSVSIKIHGTNCRVGLIEGEFMAGSHGLRRKEPADYSKNTYWYPLSILAVKTMLEDLAASNGYKQVVLFGEVFGNVQKKYNYGVPNGIDFRAFDLLIDGKYVEPNVFYELCKHYGVQTVIHLEMNYRYTFEDIKRFAESIEKDPLGDHPIEGLVIRPVVERQDRRVGRVILKYVTDTYLFGKGGSDYTDV